MASAWVVAEWYDFGRLNGDSAGSQGLPGSSSVRVGGGLPLCGAAFLQVDLEMTQLVARDDWEWPCPRLPARLAACASVVRMVVGGSARQAAGVRHGHSYGCFLACALICLKSSSSSYVGP